MMYLCIPQQRFDALPAVSSRDGLSRCKISQGGYFHVHPIFPVGKHHRFDLLANLRDLHQFIVLRIFPGHSAFLILDGFQHGVRRLNFSRDVAGVSSQALFDFFAYLFRAAGGIDLYPQAPVFDHEPAEDGIFQRRRLFGTFAAPGNLRPDNPPGFIQVGGFPQLRLTDGYRQIFQPFKGQSGLVDFIVNCVKPQRLAVGVLQLGRVHQG